MRARGGRYLPSIGACVRAEGVLTFDWGVRARGGANGGGSGADSGGGGGGGNRQGWGRRRRRRWWRRWRGRRWRWLAMAEADGRRTVEAIVARLGAGVVVLEVPVVMVGGGDGCSTSMRPRS